MNKTRMHFKGYQKLCLNTFLEIPVPPGPAPRRWCCPHHLCQRRRRYPCTQPALPWTASQWPAWESIVINIVENNQKPTALISSSRSFCSSIWKGKKLSVILLHLNTLNCWFLFTICKKTSITYWLAFFECRFLRHRSHVLRSEICNKIRRT